MIEQSTQPKTTLERIATMLKHLVEIGKSISVLALGVFVGGVFIAPSWTNEILEKSNLRIESINTPLVKVVRAEGNAVSRNSAIAAEAITKAIIRISDIVPQAQASEVVASLSEAQAALDAQTLAVARIAKEARLQVKPVSSGWLYLGYFTESGLIGKVADRVDPRSIQSAKTAPTSVRLRHDAWVVSDGDNCTKTDVTQFTPPPEDGKDILYTIVRATSEPLKISAISECPAPGKGKYIWAKIDIPAERARIASISKM